jgi:putative peptidoglycan lipid II flippase
MNQPSHHNRRIIKHLMQVSSLTLASRVIGVIREVLQARYLSFGLESDAFVTAFKIPNLLRKIFAEGALSASLVPQLVKVLEQKGTKGASKLINSTLIFFQAILLVLTFGALAMPSFVTRLIAPGFSSEQVAITVPYLQKLFPLIMIFSACAIIASALHAVNHFFIISLGPVIFNVVFVYGLAMCLYLELPVSTFVWFVIVAALLKLITRAYVYFKKGYTFQVPQKLIHPDFKQVLIQFAPCFIGAGVLELNIYFDGMFASYLPQGSVTLLNYSQRFFMLPVSVFAVALSSVLLPHFSKIKTKNSTHFNFYLFESTKLIAWGSPPIMGFMILISHPLFANLMLKGNAPPEKIAAGAELLKIFMLGYPAYALNKVLTNIFYSKQDTATPTTIMGITTTLNYVGNLVFMPYFGIKGIALSTVLSNSIATTLLYKMLGLFHGISANTKDSLLFLRRSLVQLAWGICVFSLLYVMLWRLIVYANAVDFWWSGYGYWFWVSGLFGTTMMLMATTLNFFAIDLKLLHSTSPSLPAE